MECRNKISKRLDHSAHKILVLDEHGKLTTVDKILVAVGLHHVRSLLLVENMSGIGHHHHHHHQDDHIILMETKKETEMQWMRKQIGKSDRNRTGKLLSFLYGRAKNDVLNYMRDI